MIRVVLRGDVPNLGNKGDVRDVADGYARNFLLPKGHAILATDGAARQAASMRRARDIKEAHDRQAAEAIARALVPVVIRVSARSGPEGRLFGSVTTANIADAIAEQTGVVVERHRLQLADPIKTIGTHQIPVKLHAGVEFPVTLEVVKG
jgi:large subunit ribosomal protein L9